MINFIILLCVFFSSHISAKTEVLNLSTTIDINQIYSDSIASASFIPNELVLTPTEDNQKFESVSSNLNIETTIPKGVSAVSYLSTLTKNEAVCITNGGESLVQNGFVTIDFDGTELVVNDSVSLNDFNSNDGTNKSSSHAVTFDFKRFDEITLPGTAETCSGEIEFNVMVDI
ncbi:MULTISPECIES: hypothetical protein [Aliivibrio]|uniref:Uncharacterized protein n=1 Tax=Aliivibrio finisterrensis TaxID=511998 RepID=A0A4Q5L062_9GAMM|nr:MULTISPECIES: hypothetical protein [Aliivibrio]MDD9177272.1 hypothetical protein [Aliivibrio sp. A6]RYU54760.1 hypothetical protein ERW57_00485 [Aliivibrio finisterrensis]RYU56434.1 hypothetical protein ERW56_00165 [Aliivibrio finisterrensis]RYU61555.1 hypothetical protein ERW50_00165 [Aliivibrio finisterrensis]RYU66856.1 hypothetical protein ERW53_01685 [Aliivibrio finisterrensis]